MRKDMKLTGGWATAATGLLILWLSVSLIHQYPGMLRRGLADLARGLLAQPPPASATQSPSELLEVLDPLQALDPDREWGTLLVLPMPPQLEREPVSVDAWNAAGLGDLAHEVFQLAYLGFPRKVDIAFLNSRGQLLRASYRPAERFVPTLVVDPGEYEILAAPRGMSIALDGREAVGKTSGGAIVLYKRVKP